MYRDNYSYEDDHHDDWFDEYMMYWAFNDTSEGAGDALLGAAVIGSAVYLTAWTAQTICDYKEMVRNNPYAGDDEPDWLDRLLGKNRARKK